jgi:mono/diheme cytochrome c family protein
MIATRFIGACLALAIGTGAAQGDALSAPRFVTTRPTVLIADPVDVGDARRGLAYAQKTCSGCHNVLRTEAASPIRQATPFKKIANTPGMSITALTVWSRTTHPTMPNLVIEANDMDDLIAYILSLRDQR